MKFRILSRLDSIPKGAKNNNDDDTKEATACENSCSSSSEDSGDNDAIIQELFRNMSQDETIKEENADDTFTEATDIEMAKKEADKRRGTKDKEKDGKLVEDEDDQIHQANIRSSLAEMARNFCYKWVGLYIVLFLIQQCSERYGYVTLSKWTDDTQLGNLTSLPAESADRLAMNNHYLMIYIGFGVIHAILTLVCRLIILIRMVIVARRQHSQILDRVLKAPMAFFDTTPVGRIVSRFSSHLNTVDQNLPHTVVRNIEAFGSLFIKVLVVCYTMPIFLLFLVPISYVYMYTQRYYYPTMRHLERLASKFRSPILSYFSETLGGTATVRAYGAQERFLNEFQQRVDLQEIVYWNWAHCNRWLGVRLEGLGYMTCLCVSITAVYCRESMSAGMVGLSVAIAMDITGALHCLIHVLSWLQTELPSLERVKEYVEMPIEADWHKNEAKLSESWPPSGEVKVDDLAVRYREGMDLVLKGINVNIAAGEKVGIVGRTGAGKSSLTLALFRLIEPARGHVAIDDVNTSDLGLHDLRSRLTILPQDPVIFAGSLRMNLDPFSRYTDAQLWEALRHAHLSVFVEGLEKGLGHECGEGGENLSVGQRQLLCLARTLLHKTRVLVLDEATAAVDMETDELIQTTIRSEFSECTVLTIAHRLNTVIDYDKIMVLDKGQVVEFDSPLSLMQNANSVFHSMAKSAGLMPKLPELLEKQKQKQQAAIPTSDRLKDLP